VATEGILLLRKLLNRIPKGKITTYGSLARRMGTSPRAVGRMLHYNDSGKAPCYKVIMSDGKVGGYNGGVRKKIALLKRDGIEVKNNKIVEPKEKIFKF